MNAGRQTTRPTFEPHAFRFRLKTLFAIQAAMGIAWLMACWMTMVSVGLALLSGFLALGACLMLAGIYHSDKRLYAAGLLAGVGTPRAQMALADLASQNTLPPAQRQTAAAAFARSVEAFGLLLTSEQVRRQYDRYNDSRNLSEESQKVLGALLDTIEG